MKLLLTMNLPYTRASGGANRSNRRLTERLAERGHAVRVVVPALAIPAMGSYTDFLNGLADAGIAVLNNDGVAAFSAHGVEVRAVAEQSRLQQELGYQIKTFAPDWVLVSTEDPSQRLLAAADAGAPGRVVYLAHTPQMLPFGPASLYPGPARTDLVRRAAAIVVISSFMASYVERWAGLHSRVIHPPHYDAPADRPLARRDGRVLMLNACVVKGLPIFREMARLMPDVPFAAVPGYGTTPDDRHTLEGLPNVELLDSLPELDDLFRNASVLLMPSLWLEGFGMAAVDAMLRGLPVLASNFGGLSEALLGAGHLLPVRPIERYETSLGANLLPDPVVPEQDVAPWCATLRALRADAALYERESKTALSHATEFARGLSVLPLEDLLTGLNAASARVRRVELPDARPASELANSPHTAAVAGLTPEQRALLSLTLRERAAAITAIPRRGEG